jgi:hypothetical protein
MTVLWTSQEQYYNIQNCCDNNRGDCVSIQGDATIAVYHMLKAECAPRATMFAQNSFPEKHTNRKQFIPLHMHVIQPPVPIFATGVTKWLAPSTYVFFNALLIRLQSHRHGRVVHRLTIELHIICLMLN